MIELTLLQLKRFFSKIEGRHNCWIWKAYRDKDGYGNITINKQPKRAHCISYELFKGEIPQGLQIDHLCRNTSCVNPEHLEVVTLRENLLRGDTYAANNIKKTHCPQGHEYNKANTYRDKNDGWYCRLCRRVAQQRYLQKQKVNQNY